MNMFWIIALVVVAIVVLFGLYVWYENRRARESFKHIDHSKLKDLDQDGWDDR